MNEKEIILCMEGWQKDAMTSESLVHVTDFRLQPQAKGFFLNLELYVVDEFDDRKKSKNFSGNLEECFHNGLAWIEQEKRRIRDKL